MGLADIEVTYDVRRVSICTSAHVAERIDALERQVAELRERNESLAAPAGEAELREEIARLVDEGAEHMVELTISGIASGEWRRIIGENPPPADMRGYVEWDPERFPAAALAACLTHINGEPVNETTEDALLFCDRLSQGQWARVWKTVLEVNVQGGLSAPKSLLATGSPRRSATSSTTAASEASPTVSS